MIQHRRDRLGLAQRTNEQLGKNAARPDKRTPARLRAEQAAREAAEARWSTGAASSTDTHPHTQAEDTSLVLRSVSRSPFKTRATDTRAREEDKWHWGAAPERSHPTKQNLNPKT